MGFFVEQSQGTWTPTITFATAGNLSVAYTNQIGRYIKSGNLVEVYFNILTSTFTYTTASGIFRINGLPFTVATALDGSLIEWQGITKASYTFVAANPIEGATRLQLRISGSGQAPANVQHGDMPTAGTVSLVGSARFLV